MGKQEGLCNIWLVLILSQDRNFKVFSTGGKVGVLFLLYLQYPSLFSRISLILLFYKFMDFHTNGSFGEGFGWSSKLKFLLPLDVS